MELLLVFFSPNTIQLIGFVEILMKIFIYLKILKILKFLISSLLNLANGPAVHCIWKACAPSDIAAAATTAQCIGSVAATYPHGTAVSFLGTSRSCFKVEELYFRKLNFNFVVF